MTPDDWNKLEAAFQEALDLPETERDRFVVAFSDENPNLAQPLMDLLTAHHGSDNMLSAPIAASVESLVRETEDPWVGRPVGVWTITERIAAGGMGVVFMAERSDHQFEQRVAIKIMSAQLLVSDAVARFKAERQILANLKHSYIAQLHDGGTTDDGLPYLVMEFVEGQPIDRYCDACQLGVEDRLRLFQKVCDAVDYAHRNLTVHRDLKPNNILIDTFGDPKLLDFGIAKLLDPGAVDMTVAMTQHGARAMTPEYASPEQVRGETVSVATDVYSLGVLLYRLITGVSPYGAEVTSPLAYERAIIEHAPRRPSTVVTSQTATALDGDDRLRSNQLIKKISSDLDNIVLKALQKDPDRRYLTVGALAADIERFLRHEPVIARGDSWTYRARKFARRHATALSAAAAVVAGVSALVVFYTLELAGERDRAQLEADKAQSVSEFLLGVFEAPDPSRAQGETTTARELLDRGASRIDEALVGSTDVRATMEDVMGGAYLGLGLYDASRELLDRAFATRVDLHGQDHADVIETLSRIALLEYLTGDYERSTALYRDAIERSRRVHGEESEMTAWLLAGLGNSLFEAGDHDQARVALESAFATQNRIAPGDDRKKASTLHALGWVVTTQGEHDLAAELLTRSIEMLKLTAGARHPEVPRAMNHLVYTYTFSGQWTEAEATMREGLALTRQILGDEHVDLSGDLQTLATILENQGRYGEAEALYRESLVMDLKLLGDEHPYIALDKNNLAGALRAQGRYEDAETYYRESLALNQSVVGPEHRETATSMANLATVLAVLGRFDEAEPLYLKSHEIRADVFGDDHRDTLAAAYVYGLFLHVTDRLDEARQTLQSTLEARRELLGERHPHVAMTLAASAAVLSDIGELDAASESAALALEIHREHFDAQHPRLLHALHVHATIVGKSDDADRADGLFQELITRRRAALRDDHPALAIELTAYGEFLVAQGRAADARPQLEEALTIRERSLPAGHWETAVTRSLLGDSLSRLGQTGAGDLLAAAHDRLRAVRGEDDRFTRQAAARLAAHRQRV